MHALKRVQDQLERLRLDRGHKQRHGFSIERDEESIALLEEYEGILNIKKVVTRPGRGPMKCPRKWFIPKGDFAKGGIVPGQGAADFKATVEALTVEPGETVEECREKFKAAYPGVIETLRGMTGTDVRVVVREPKTSSKGE